MTSRLAELEARLNPILAAKTTARQQELINAVRKVTHQAIQSGNFGGSRMFLELEVVYRDELAGRGQLIWETVLYAANGLRPFKPIELADDVKHFINNHLEEARSALARELKKHCGTRTQNNPLGQRLEMHELREELLRSYGAKLDLWARQQQHEMASAATQRRWVWFVRAIEWVFRILRGGIGK